MTGDSSRLARDSGLTGDARLAGFGLAGECGLTSDSVLAGDAELASD